MLAAHPGYRLPNPCAAASGGRRVAGVACFNDTSRLDSHPAPRMMLDSAFACMESHQQQQEVAAVRLR
jgi:hypothetical protein